MDSDQTYLHLSCFGNLTKDFCAITKFNYISQNSFLCRDILQLYRDACVHLYEHNMTDLSRLIDIAGQCLLSGGRVIYCGRDTDGIIAMVDASECVPTYGSSKLWHFWLLIASVNQMFILCRLCNLCNINIRWDYKESVSLYVGRYD